MKVILQTSACFTTVAVLCTLPICSARSRRRNTLSEKYCAEYFRHCPTGDIERQNNAHGEREYVELIVEYQIPERKQLMIRKTLPAHLDRRFHAGAL
jgi:hypothetical protein